jgi:predicted nucleic acid-binding protein
MAMSEPRASIICDAGPLIHLDELGCLDLLGDFQEVLVPEAVWHEVQRHRPGALDNPSASLIRRAVPILEDASLKVLAQALALNTGETQALTLAVRNPDSIFLTDDAAARLAAERIGLRVHGTIGVILRAIRRQQRTPEDVLAILDAIPHSSTLYIRDSLLKAIAAQVVQEHGAGRRNR